MNAEEEDPADPHSNIAPLKIKSTKADLDGNWSDRDNCPVTRAIKRTMKANRVFIHNVFNIEIDEDVYRVNADQCKTVAASFSVRPDSFEFDIEKWPTFYEELNNREMEAGK